MPDNQLATTGRDMNSIARRIETINSADDARACIDDMDFLKAALKQARKYREYIREYAALECEMWLNIATRFPWDKREPGQFSRSERILLNWIDKHRTKDWCDHVLNIAKTEGVSIFEQKTQSIRDQNAAAKENAGKRAVSRVIQRVKKDGVIKRLRNELESAHYHECGFNPNPWELSTMLDRARIELRSCGAVSVGNGTGTYVMPDTASTYDLVDAISIRLCGIFEDIAKACTLLESANGRGLRCDHYIRDAKQIVKGAERLLELANASVCFDAELDVI